MLALAQFLDKVWLQYSAANPQAVAIEQLFKSEGETPVNDHIAFRTFADSRISIDILEIELFALGYHLLDNYQFETKQLDARCYIHDQSPTKIFISELRWQQLSPAAQAVIVDLIEQTYVTLKSPVLDQNSVNISPLLTAGRLWRLPSYCQYRLLLAESEYAAWLSVWGLRANHFTVFVNMLNKYSRLEQVVALLQQQGYRLNQVGGIIKGTEHDLLIQAATLAGNCNVEFKDAGEQQVSGCYYEFAQRFKQADGMLYQGFVQESADKIFESTNSSGDKRAASEGGCDSSVKL